MKQLRNLVAAIAAALLAGNLFAQSPGAVGPNLQIWLKANSGPEEAPGDPAETGDALTRWLDLSGSNRHYISVAGPTLLDNAVNFNPVVQILSGGFDAPAAVGAELGNDWTVITISRKLASDQDGRVFDGHTTNFLWSHWGTYTNSIYIGGNPSNYNSGIATTTGIQNLHLHSFVRSSTTTNIEARADGTSLATFNATNSANGVRIDINQGAHSGEDSDSQIGEMIVYSRALSAAELFRVESYLAIKYGLQISHNYVTSAGAVIWDVTANSGYNHDVAGIGRQDNSALNQRRSKSINTNSWLTIDKGGNFPNDNSYIVWGDDNGTGSTTNVSSSFSYRSNRIWKAGVAGTPGTVSVSFDLTNAGLPITTDVSDYTLLLDTDSDFSSGATSHTTGASLVGNTLTFTNVPLTNNLFFTVALSNLSGPGGIGANLSTWLKADGPVWEAPSDPAENGDAITTWRDVSGFSRHYTAVAGPTLQTSTLNFNPSVQILSGGFDAPVGAELGNDWTTFFVSRKLASGPNGRLFDGHTGNFLWGWWSNYTNSLFLSTNPAQHNTGIATTAGLTNLHLHTYKRAATGSLEARVEGTSLNTFAGTNSANGIRIDINQGQFAGEASQSRVAEMIVYSSALSASDVNKVESYLGIKYGITLTHDYVSSDGTTLWNIASNAGFNNDITGIGRDDVATLNQQKSTTINSSNDITIDKGGAFSSDKSFILWGNNAGSGVSTNVPSPYKVVSGKAWKVNTTNSPGVVIVSVTLPAISIPNTGSAGDYALLIDTDTDFSSGATVHTTGASLVGNVLTFTNVALSNNSFIAIAADLSFPGGVPGVATWVKGDVGVTGTTNVSQWDDQSGFANNLTQATAANQPSLQTSDVNFHNTISFSGNTQIMTFADPPANLNSLVFTVARPLATTGNWRTMLRGVLNDHPLILETGTNRLGYYDNDAGGFKASGFNWLPTEASVVALEMRSGDVNFRKNGTQGASNNTINLSAVKLDYFGNYQGNGQQFGRIAETIIYNTASALTTLQKEKVESYLAVKYGITLTHNYVASDGTVTWNTTTNAAYSNNIGGLGRDDNSALDQRKTLSVNTGAGLTIEKTGAFASNLTFLTWGNDGGTATSTNVSSAYTIRSGRTWKAAVTGAPGVVTVSIDLTTISLPNTGNATDYTLLKDTDGDFAIGSIAHTTGASIVGNILTFTNVSFANNDFFAFAVSNLALPGGIAGGVFWVKGETGVIGTTDVSQWTDQSGFSNHAVQATVASQPTLTTNNINFRNVVNFNSSPDFFTLTAPPVNLNSTIFTVAAPVAPGSNWRTMFRGQSNDHQVIVENGSIRLGYYDADGGGFQNSGFTWAGSEVALVGLEMRAGDVNFRKNGSQGASITTVNHTGIDLYAFGNYQAGAQQFGRIAETIIYNTASPLTTPEKEKIETYLAVKYGITLTHNYTASNNTVVWNTTTNAGYNNNISGVGRDDGSGLANTRTLSVHSNATVTVETPGAIATNNSFLIFGDDAATGTSPNVPSGFLLRTTRVWKTSVTGTPGVVSVSFNLPALGLPATGVASDFAVLVDTDTDFSSGATAHTTGASLVGNVLTFTNLSLSNNSFFTLVASNLIQPGGLTGSVFWVKGDVGVTGTTDVSAWADQSGNNRNAIQGNATLQPTLTTNNINSHAVVDFNTVTDIMVITPNTPGLNSTTYIVGAPRNNGNYRTFIRSQAGGDHQMLLNNGTTALGYYDQDGGGFLNSTFTWAQNEIAAVTMEMRASNVNFRKNGQQGTTISTVNLTNQNIDWLGNYSGGSQAPGRIAEVIIFNTGSAMSAIEKQQVESYLGVKYGLTLQHDYVNTLGAVVWNMTTNTTHHNDVTGIGRDDATGLDQRRSTSVNATATVTMDLGGPFSANRSYLIWGNNTGAMNSNTTTDYPAGSGLVNRLNRTWKIAKAGTVGGVTVNINLSSVPGSKTASHLRLLIDRNLNGLFADESTGGGGVISGATDLGGGVFQFTGVTFNDGELFTVGSVNSGTPLPVSLTSFRVKLTDDGVKLDWTTASEINNDYFTIDKSPDGIDFFEIGKVKGSGTTDLEQKYTFVDGAPLPGRSYYRLKQRDFDGQITFSKVVSLDYETLPVLYPNPATREVSVDVNGNEQVSAELVNAIGQRLYVKQSVTPGRVSWNVENLPRGIYFITILRNETLTTQKLVLID